MRTSITLTGKAGMATLVFFFFFGLHKRILHLARTTGCGLDDNGRVRSKTIVLA